MPNKEKQKKALKDWIRTEGGYQPEHLIGDHELITPPNGSGFTKNDSGKLQWSLMPFIELEEVVRVLMNGAKTYSPDNWKKCDDVNRYKDALMRHVVSYVKGETYDTGKDGDGLHHLAHAVCDCLFLMWFDNQKEEKKDV